jgi:hypothetical protein
MEGTVSERKLTPDLAEIEARASKAKERASEATPGPWTADLDDTGEVLSGQRIIATLHYQGDEGIPNQMFIAAARTDVPALADDCLALVARVRELEAQIECRNELRNRAEAAEARVKELEAVICRGCAETLVAEKELQARIAKLERMVEVARDALDTYAQFERNGEVTFVSGALAQNARTEMDEVGR